MTLGPLFRREFLAPGRGRRPFRRRVAEAILLLGTALAIYGVVFEMPYAIGRGWVATPEARRLWVGRIVFLTTFALEGFLLTLRVADAAGAAVAEERDRDTLPWLILTRLTAPEIVATKALARGLAAAGLSLVGLPLLVGSATLAGLEAELPLALAILASTAGFAAAVATLAGVRATPAATAKGWAGLAVLAALVGPPVLAVIPVGTGTTWRDLLAELQLAARLVAPLSPVSLLTDLGWLYRPTVDRLEVRVAVLVGLQAAAGLAALGLAAARLRPGERPAGRGDPARGGRARCGDDPILWREHLLPVSQRRLGALALVGQLRLLLRSLVLNLLAILGTLLALAVPAGVVLATIYYGAAAFREQWGPSWTTSAGPSFAARDRFNGLIRAFTSLALFFPILAVPATLIGRFALERDRKTWDDFLMTPLDGAAILRSKARVAWRGFRRPAAWTAGVWAVGVASGSLAPLAVAPAAGEFAAMIALMIALGLGWGARPLSKDAASNRAVLGSLGLVAAHGPPLYVLSLPPRDLARLGEWSPRVGLAVGLAWLVVVLATATLARLTYRRAVARFDEWVDRPRRPPRAARGASRPDRGPSGPAVADDPAG